MQKPIDNTVWPVMVAEIMDIDRYLSSANAPDIEEDARLCIASGGRDMVLNCRALAYLTGAGLRAFLNIARMMKEAGGKLSVTGLTGQPREFFDACGIDRWIPSVDDVAKSLSTIHAA